MPRDMNRPEEGIYIRKSDGVRVVMEYTVGGNPKIKYRSGLGQMTTKTMTLRGFTRNYRKAN